jgi:hypothetical protein
MDMKGDQYVEQRDPASCIWGRATSRDLAVEHP